MKQRAVGIGVIATSLILRSSTGAAMKVTIKNAHYGEYVYVGDPELDSDSRYMLTWSGSAGVNPYNDDEFQWDIDQLSNRNYHIKNKAKGENACVDKHKARDNGQHFMFTSVPSKGMTSFSPHYQFEINSLSNGLYTIRSNSTGEYVSSGSSTYDSERRYVLTGKDANPVLDDKIQWEIKPVKFGASSSTPVGPHAAMNVAIMSAAKGEYAYAGEPRDKVSRYMLTWTPTTKYPDLDWVITPLGSGKYSVMNSRFGEYAYAGKDGHYMLTDRANLFPEISDLYQFEISPLFNGKFTVKNVRYGQYVYVGNPELHGDSRYMLTWAKEDADPYTNHELQWEISALVLPSAEQEFTYLALIGAPAGSVPPSLALIAVALLASVAAFALRKRRQRVHSIGSQPVLG